MKVLLSFLLCSSSMFAQDYIFNSTIINSNIGGSRVDLKCKGSGQIVTKNIFLKERFNSINIDTAGNIVITNSKYNKVFIRTDSNLISKCSVYIKNGTLYIKSKGNFIPSDELYINIDTHNLNSLTIDGSSDIKVNGYNTESLTLNINGSANLNFNSNSIGRLTIDADGSYYINLLKSRVKKATIKASGAGDIKIDVSNSLDISVDGTTDIRYRGNPKITKEINGVADLIKIR